LNLARSAAMDLAHDGIRVNTITPCAMEHQLWTKMSDELETGYSARRAPFVLFTRRLSQSYSARALPPRIGPRLGSRVSRLG